MVSLRAIGLGLVLVPLNAYWVILSELRWGNMLTLNPLFVTPIFCLLVLAGANRVLAARRPRWVLRPGELVTIYLMLVMSCTVATHDYLINLMSIVPWPRWAATPENQWETRMLPYLPRWLFVWNKDLLEDCFKGNGTLYDARVIAMWLVPLAWWTLFIMAAGWMTLCVTVLLRKAWMDNTRLAFPIVRLPAVLTEPDSPTATLRSRVFWAGFAVATLLGVTNGLSEWLPSIPHLPVRAQWFTFPTQPWATISPFPLTFYPFIIGLAFLVPLDVSFSVWFFFLFYRAQMVALWQYGEGNTYDFSFVSQQATGAWYAFGFFLLYSSRSYLRQVWQTAWGHSKGADAGEPLSYRAALGGLAASSAVFFLFWWAAGMSPGWVIVVLVTYLIVAICFARIRAEAGSVHETWDLEATRLFRFFDTQAIGSDNLAVAHTQHWFWRMGRCHFMPNQLEGFKLAHDHRMKMSHTVLPMMAALLLATVVGMWACLRLFYRDGALAKCPGFPTWTTYESFDTLGSLLTTGRAASPGWYWPFGFAVLFVAFLSWMRSQFLWFPLHPFGYLLGPLMHLYWFPFLIAWVLKGLLLHYGGLRAYRRAIPFFLGVVLGDYVNGAAWSLVGIFGQVPVYGIFH